MSLQRQIELWDSDESGQRLGAQDAIWFISRTQSLHTDIVRIEKARDESWPDLQRGCLSKIDQDVQRERCHQSERGISDDVGVREGLWMGWLQLS